MVNLLMVDDHQSILDGLQARLREVNEFNIVGTAPTKEKALEKIRFNKEIELVILDIEVHETKGDEIAREIKRINNDIKIILYSMHSKLKYIQEFEKLGVDGYVMKDEGPSILVKAILCVMEGRKWIDEGIRNAKKSIFKYNGKEFEISGRQEEVLKYTCMGYKKPKIADELNLNVETIKTHQNRLMQKTNSKNLAELIGFAHKHGFC